jgi:hypothetical protein
MPSPAPIPEFLTPNANDTVPAEVLLNRIADDYIELTKLRIEYEKKLQSPDLQKAYKFVVEHKGFLLSQLMVEFYMSLMNAITELEFTDKEDPTLNLKLKYTPLS